MSLPDNPGLMDDDQVPIDLEGAPALVEDQFGERAVFGQLRHLSRLASTPELWSGNAERRVHSSNRWDWVWYYRNTNPGMSALGRSTLKRILDDPAIPAQSL